jgi:uncharacterized protein YggE
MKNTVVVFLILALTVLLSSIALAQDVPIIPAQSTQNGITVSGHSEIDAKPDVAYATLGVTVQAPAQADAVSQAAAKSTAVKDALIKAGVANADIQQDSYQVQPQYDYHTSPGVLVGYQVANMFKVTIHNLPKVGVIVDKATQAGANQVNDVTYDLTDRSVVQGQALAAAVTNARSKADLMAGAAGVTVGRLISLQENGGQQTVRPMPMMFGMARNVAAAPTTPIQQQDIIIDANVTAFYSIGYGK